MVDQPTMHVEELIEWLYKLPGDAIVEIGHPDVNFVYPAGVVYEGERNIVHFWSMTLMKGVFEETDVFDPPLHACSCD